MKRAIVLWTLLLVASAGCSGEDQVASENPPGSGTQPPPTVPTPPTTPPPPATPEPPSAPSPPSAPPPTTPVPADPGCGLGSAAFCDTFESIATSRGRAGDLDSSKWSLSRGNPQLPTSNGTVIPVGPATLPTCRANQPQKVFPGDDSLICSPNAQIPSNHLLAAVGAQNYGQNSYRIRQPFDFAGRTGKIVFDAESVMHPLLGWISVALTEDPAPVPGYSLGPAGQTNDEGGATPRRGVIVAFTACNNNMNDYAVRFINVIENHQDALRTPASLNCLPAKAGHVSHIEIRVSQQRIDVYGTPYAEDGKSFSQPVLMYGADVNLPFSRGYVQLTVHNHATAKYDGRDAWIARFDNVGFDGPVVSNYREYEIPDSLVSGSGAFNIAGPSMNVGYRIRDAAEGPGQTLTFRNVDLKGAVSAQLAIAAWYLLWDVPLEGYVLKYRFNGGPWRNRTFTTGELALLKNTHQLGQLAQVLEVPLTDLVAGDNTVEFVTQGVPQNYPPAVSAIDLVIRTN